MRKLRADDHHDDNNNNTQRVLNILDVVNNIIIIDRDSAAPYLVVYGTGLCDF